MTWYLNRNQNKKWRILMAIQEEEHSGWWEEQAWRPLGWGEGGACLVERGRTEWLGTRTGSSFPLCASCTRINSFGELNPLCKQIQCIFKACLRLHFLYARFPSNANRLWYPNSLNSELWTKLSSTIFCVLSPATISSLSIFKYYRFQAT